MLINMGLKFPAQYPVFGTKNKRKSLSYQQRSPYYWWWAYLRKNENYIVCCNNDGKGEFAELYKDFGDVRDDDFRFWWNERGATLFADFSIPTVTQLKDKSEWDEQWVDNSVLVFAVPLTPSKRDIQRAFARLLKKVHTGKRGRTKNTWEFGNAAYKINRNFTINSLSTALTVYEAYTANQLLPKSERLKIWEIGVKLRLVGTAMPNSKDLHADNLIKRNRMAATVMRYVKQSKLIVDGISLGIFPA